MKCEYCDGTGEVTEADLDYRAVCEATIAELNKLAGTNYKPNAQATRKLVIARMNQQFKLEDFMTVVRSRCEQWLHDTKMKEFLRPSTLFGPKFEGYLQAAGKPPKKRAKLVY